jgi:hypothetical protein
MNYKKIVEELFETYPELASKLLDDILEKKAEKKAKAKKAKKANKAKTHTLTHDWTFKPSKTRLGHEHQFLCLIKAMCPDKLYQSQELYKTDSPLTNFTYGDFQKAIDTNKKSCESPLFRVAKYLQKDDFGKIVFHKKKVDNEPS